jgi:ABC-type multidrug transport system fused ATPase/permease subunit
MFEFFVKIKSLLTKHERQQSFFMLFLSFINSLMDVISLALLLPLIGLCLNAEMAKRNAILHSIYAYFHFASPITFTLIILLTTLFIFILKALLSTYINYLINKFTFDIASRISEKNLHIFYSLSMNEVNATNSMLFFREIRNSPALFSNLVLQTVFQLVSEIIVLILILIGLILTDVKVLLLFSIIIIPILGLFYSITKKRVKVLEKEVWDLDLASAKKMNESILGFIDIILLNKRKHFISDFMNLSRKVNTKNLQKSIIGLLPHKILEVVSILGILIIFIFNSYIYHQTGTQLLTLITVYAIASYRLLPSVNRIVLSLLTIQKNTTLLNDLVSFNNRGSNFMGVDVFNEKEEAEISFNHEIEFHQVSFSYLEKSTFHLNAISLTINKGQKIGIIGKSGSGKTTLINLFLRFLTETEGYISVDGVSLNPNNTASWRRKIAYIPQDIYILDATIQENIAFGVKHVNIEKLNKVVQLAQLSDLVQSLDKGLNTYVGEKGAQISGGQKQRIGIARALYRDSEILILDEATNALDMQTESEINATIKNLDKENVTMLIVAHRISTLSNCDKIYELKDGKLIGQLNYSDLIK